jgi:hypothetical protein
MASSSDYLKCGENKTLRECLSKISKSTKSSAEKVIFSDIVLKENTKGTKQSRCLIITNAAAYSMKPGKYSGYQKRIDLGTLDGIYLTEGSLDFVLHARGDDYLRLDSKRRGEIVATLTEAVKALTVRFSQCPSLFAFFFPCCIFMVPSSPYLIVFIVSTFNAISHCKNVTVYICIMFAILGSCSSSCHFS